MTGEVERAVTFGDEAAENDLRKPAQGHKQHAFPDPGGHEHGFQEAAVEALKAGPEWYEALNAEYRRRREVACRIMDTLGCTYDNNAGGLYVWGRVPETPGQAGGDVIADSDRPSPAQVLSDKILYEAGVFLTPGFIFGSNGAHHLRISLCANVETLNKALKKICAL